MSREQTLSFIDGYLTALTVLGHSREAAFERWEEQFGDEFEPDITRYRRQKPGLSERIYFTDDFAGNAARATEWLRGVARAALLDPAFMEKLDARKDELPQVFRQVFLGLTLSDASATEYTMSSAQRGNLRHARELAVQFQKRLGQVGGRKRLDLLAHVLGVLGVIHSGATLPDLAPELTGTGPGGEAG